MICSSIPPGDIDFFGSTNTTGEQLSVMLAHMAQGYLPQGYLPVGPFQQVESPRLDITDSLDGKTCGSNEMKSDRMEKTFSDHCFQTPLLSHFMHREKP